jgi:hypothetical protein
MSAEGFQELNAEEDIWVYEGRRNRGMDNTT